ncbi:hypothetical protein BH683_019410 [Williamsia sp. 1138]|uniref:PH domain-containing protein n=1 Tax=Williamsia sp. 1138 TaxID=1903117 RepID=UPI000A114688|nr:PH domain-containing protein [Williamsia sp. 1138]OZG27552.1 hypothetical protein BH683_019410 [Williamsia sp. 1138]
MDNSASSTLSWSTPPAMAGVMVAGGVLLGVAALVAGPDPAGVLLMVIAAVLLLVLGAIGLRVRPRLAVVDTHTLAIRTLTGGVRRYAFDEVRRAQVISYPRLGRRVPHLEFDIDDATAHDGERLVIFGRWDLGANPLDVADALREAGLAIQERK